MSFRWPTRRVAKPAPKPKVSKEAVAEAIAYCVNGEDEDRRNAEQAKRLEQVETRVEAILRHLGIEPERRRYEAPGT